MKAKIGKYLVTERIARGGMGEILKAKHPTLNRDVILKRLTFSAEQVVIERFKREAQLQIDFRNENIVQVYDHFKEGLSYYIVMEYVDGVSLDALIEKHRYLPCDIALLIFYQVARALKYAHDKGVIHRDIKPANVLISKEGVVKLTDFGIATSKDCRDRCLTKEMTLGTPAYMSPEQISDTKNVDKRADIYSMGVVLYEMVTGKCPFPGDITSENITRIQKGRYPRPSKLNPKVTAAVSRIIKKAMHHRIKRRYQDLEELIKVLSVRLRKYKNQEMIDETIRLFLQGKSADPKKIGKKASPARASSPAGGTARRLLKGVLALSVLLALLTGAGYYAYKKGYHHEWYGADEFGALRAEVTFTATDRTPAPRYISGTLLVRGPKGYTQEPGAGLAFTPGREPDVYTSSRIYLPAGSYRLMVDIDNRVYQRDFFLKPRSAQKADKETGGAQVISIDHAPVASMPLTFSFEVRDAGTGAIITDAVDCFINYNNQWVKWQDFTGRPEAAGFLVSGRKYIFNFTGKDYYTRTVTIDVLPHQASVDIMAEMAPYPGTLLIRSSEPGVELLINNNPYYVEGGSSPKIVRPGPLSPEIRRIILPPKSYFITARAKGITRTESIEILSTKYTHVIVNVNRENNTMTFSIF